MGLAGRNEWVLGPDVHPNGTGLEPRSSTSGHHGRFRHLVQSEHVAKERTRHRLAADGDHELDVVDADPSPIGHVLDAGFVTS